MSNPPDRKFATTRWTLVMAAARESRSGSREALEDLCTRYWPPLYSFARRRGYSVEQSQDLTQSFFARLLEKRSLEAADPGRGRFRSFLLGSFKHFLANEWDRERAQKRGGGVVSIPIEPEVAEGLYVELAVETDTPEEVFERQWASAVLERAVATLREECDHAGRGALFACLEGVLRGEKLEGGHAEAARALGMTEGSVKVTVHRLHRRYRDLLRSEIERTAQRRQRNRGRDSLSYRRPWKEWAAAFSLTPLRRLLAWNDLSRPAVLLLPLMAFIALREFRPETHPLEWWWSIAWSIGIAVHYWIQWRSESEWPDCIGCGTGDGDDGDASAHPADRMAVRAFLSRIHGRADSAGMLRGGVDARHERGNREPGAAAVCGARQSIGTRTARRTGHPASVEPQHSVEAASPSSRSGRCRLRHG